MRVNDADAAILENVVAAEQQIAHLERQLTIRMPRRVPDLKLEVADLDEIPVS